MKRFLLFYYAPYEAMGGINDLVDEYDTLEDAIQGLAKEDSERHFPENFCAHIYDINTKSVVFNR